MLMGMDDMQMPLHTLDKRLRTETMVLVSNPTDTAAYRECGVMTYSWTASGRQTGSATAMRKS